MLTRSATPPNPPILSRLWTTSEYWEFCDAATSAAVGPSAASFWISWSIAASSSSAVWPGLAVATISKTEPSVSDWRVAFTSCAIFFS